MEESFQDKKLKPIDYRLNLGHTYELQSSGVEPDLFLVRDVAGLGEDALYYEGEELHISEEMLEALVYMVHIGEKFDPHMTRAIAEAILGPRRQVRTDDGKGVSNLEMLIDLTQSKEGMGSEYTTRKFLEYFLNYPNLVKQHEKLNDVTSSDEFRQKTEAVRRWYEKYQGVEKHSNVVAKIISTINRELYMKFRSPEEAEIDMLRVKTADQFDQLDHFVKADETAFRENSQKYLNFIYEIYSKPDNAVRLLLQKAMGDEDFDTLLVNSEKLIEDARVRGYRFPGDQ